MHEPNLESGPTITYEASSDEPLAEIVQVEPAIDHEQVEAELEEFLQDNAGVFAAVNDVWRSVNAAQQSVKTALDAVTPGLHKTVSQSRVIIAAATKNSPTRVATNTVTTEKARHIEIGGNMFIACSAEAGYNLAKKMIANPSGEGDLSVRDRADSMRSELDKGGQSIVANFGFSPTAMLKFRNDPVFQDVTSVSGLVFDEVNELTLRYAEAYYMQNAAMVGLEDFLRSHPGSGAAFVDRLAELNQDYKRGFTEYPGLLDVVAARLGDMHNRQLLLSIIENDRIDDELIKSEIVRLCFEDPERLVGAPRKEISLIVMTAMCMSKAFDIDTENVTQDTIMRLVGVYEDWPDALRKAYESRLKEITVNTKSRLLRTTKDHVTHGRLEPKALSTAISVMSLPVGVMRRRNTDKKSKGRSASVHAETVSIEDFVRVYGEDVVRKAPVIGSFGTLRHVSNDRPYDVVLTHEIDDLLEEKVIRDYLSDYVGEKELPDAVWLFISHLSEFPMDRENTRRLRRGKTIEIMVAENDEDNQKVSLRVFEPRTVPGVANSNIIKRTRIIYGIASVNDEPTLVISDVRLHRSEDKY